MQCRIESTDEILIALLSEYEFDSFEEIDENTTIAYIRIDNLPSEVKKEIETLIQEKNVGFHWAEVEDKNWNEIWESNFQPIKIEDKIIIRADFHPKDKEYDYDIIINRKMAFGTGHHATTYMMMQSMLDIDMKQKSVFDYGCGTGILAILASMLGAENIFAIDIEKESYLNTIENAVINNVKNIEAVQGEILLVEGKSYDIILANINRNVLLDSVNDISKAINPEGKLLLSGILIQDFEIINDTYSKEGFVLKNKLEREGWLCLMYNKINSDPK